MASKKAPIIVTIKKTKHATQPWAVTINEPGKGPDTKIAGRYTRPDTAKIGARRKLRAKTAHDVKTGTFVWMSNGREIKFVFDQPKGK